ncbi:MAG: hypothetical protein IPJ98_27950 [Bryobacterales bacterium]|nr:hypothetical protein [Bryobacterales bacterium]
MLQPLDTPPAAAPHTPALPAPARIPTWVPLLLCLPAFLPLLVTALAAWSGGLVPTVFVQYDLPYYVANARQHFAEGLRLTYSNPYGLYGSPALYFQPHLFLLALLQWAGLSPQLAWLLFGLAAAAFAALAAARLYEHWAGWDTTAQKLGFVCFFWGGGILALGGLLLGSFAKAGLPRSLHLLDPADGWWMLNFGRNLVYPTEAFYHGLFLTAILFLLQRRFGLALATAATLSLSHPFTGLTLALLFCAWSLLELLLRSGASSPRLLLGSLALAAAHLGYYMVFLNRFPAHRSVRDQFSLDWPYSFWTIVPALYLVGVLLIGRLTRWRHLSAMLSQPRTRLCFVWFATVLALTQHDLFIRPMQPIHFAHGYDWIALFLLATPPLLLQFEKLLALPRPAVRLAATSALLLLFISDNLLWFSTFRWPTVRQHAVVLTPDQDDILRWLALHPQPAAYVASTDRWLGYLTPTFTPMRPWHGHDYNTPFAAQRKRELEAAFAQGTPLPTNAPVFYIHAKRLAWTAPPRTHLAYANPSFEIWRSSP